LVASWLAGRTALSRHRYGWLYELPPVLAEAFTEDLARLSMAAHRMRDVAGRSAW
jgi:hypothetical protein